jgi:exopolysaccharide biosynthesis polyprenyl glycosylphosphotransferase
VQDQVFPARSRRRAIVRGALLASDLIALVFATQAASFLRFGQIFQVGSPELPIWFNFIHLSLLMIGVWLASLWLESLYDLSRVFWGTGEYSRVIRAMTLGVIGVIVIEYLLHAVAISRSWTVLAWLFACAFVIGGRALVRTWIAAERRRGSLLRPTLLVGDNAEATNILRVLRANSESGLVPVGCLASSHMEQSVLNQCGEGDAPCLGHAGEIQAVLDAHFVDTVLIASTAFEHDILARIINDLRDRDVDIQLSSGLFDVSTSRVMIREASGIPLITIKSVSFAPWKRVLKRTFDLLIGGSIVLLGLPLWVALALAIRLDSQGAVFYRQERIGRDGQPFGMLKFRSMCVDAESQLDKLHADSRNEATGPLFKMTNDPRVTTVGKWMRKYSIDEFPQLLNVLRGEMSLVGPRPPLPGETASYTDHHWRRMEVLPGMTGLWQVSGRSRLTFDEMVRLDLFYIENWSVGFDLGLMMRTIPAVLLARGAY